MSAEKFNIHKNEAGKWCLGHPWRGWLGCSLRQWDWCESWQEAVDRLNAELKRKV